MKATPFRLALVAVAMVFSGCIVQSFNAFHTEETSIETPDLAGKWKVLREWGDEGKTVWTFEKDHFNTVDSDEHTGQVSVTFFKLGETVFCDSRAGNQNREDTPNWQWLWHVVPVHSVFLVKIEPNRLEFRPLDLKWTTNNVSTLPCVRRSSDEGVMFTATPEQWEAFLTKHAGNDEAFPTNHIYILERTK